jgi:hypothetical protein
MSGGESTSFGAAVSPLLGVDSSAGAATRGGGMNAHNPTRRWHNAQCRREVSRRMGRLEGILKLNVLLGGRWQATDEAREREGVEALDGPEGVTEFARDREDRRGSGAAWGAMAQPKSDARIGESGGSSGVSGVVACVKTSASPCPSSFDSSLGGGRAKADIVDRNELSWFAD